MLCHWNHRSGIDIKFSSTVNQFNNFIIIGINLKSAFFGHFRPYFLFYLIKHLFFFISSKWTLHPYILESCEKMIHFLSFSFILIPIFGSFLSRNAISPKKSLSGDDSEYTLYHVITQHRINPVMNFYACMYNTHCMCKWGLLWIEVGCYLLFARTG